MIFFLISLLLPCFSLALDSRIDKLEKNQILPSEKLLYEKNVLQLSIDDLRFNLPQSKWYQYRSELFSGLYVQIINDFFDDKKKAFDLPLNFYDDLQMSKLSFSLKDESIIVEGKTICKYQKPSQKIVSDTFYSCGYNFCTYHHMSTKKVRLDNYAGLNGKLTDYKNEQCKFNIDYFPEFSESSYSATNIRLESYDQKSKVGIVKSGDKKYFLDLRVCNSNPDSCFVKTKDISNFSTAWINLKVTQSKQDYEVLNYLIANLGPCLKREDTNCIKKFFVSNEELNTNAKFDFPYVPTVNKDLIESLTQCLDYNNLLPYGGRAKDLKGNVCIFYDNDDIVGGHKFKIYSVSLPDAYKSDDRVLNVNYEIPR